MTEKYIAPCPFCGRAAEVVKWDSDDEGAQVSQVDCGAEDCPGAHTWQDTVEEAIELWNKRSLPL